MPQKDKQKRKEYNRKQYERHRNEIKQQYLQQKYKTIWLYKMQHVNAEFTQRAILRIHIFQWRILLKDMLTNHFKKRLIKKYDRTDLITQSWRIWSDRYMLQEK